MTGTFSQETEIKAKQINSPHTFSISSSNLTSITGGDAPSVLHSSSSPDISLSLFSVSFEDCASPLSVCGGGLLFFLSPGGELSVRQSVLRECVAGNKRVEEKDDLMNQGSEPTVVQGKGGGMYISSPSANTIQVLPLPLLFQNISLISNNAWVGRDIYLSCVSLSSQINEFMFQFDLRESKYNRNNAIWGADTLTNKERDLISLIITYQDDTIHVYGDSNDATNRRMCGSKELPCSSLSV
jgi:hypothetical protein